MPVRYLAFYNQLINNQYFTIILSLQGNFILSPLDIFVYLCGKTKCDMKKKSLFLLALLVPVLLCFASCSKQQRYEDASTRLSLGQAHNQGLDSLISHLLKTRSAISLYEGLLSENPGLSGRDASDFSFSDLSDDGKGFYADLNARLLHLDPSMQDTSDLVSSVIQWDGLVQLSATLTNDEKDYLLGLGDIAVYSIRYWSENDPDWVAAQIEGSISEQESLTRGRTVTGRVFNEEGDPAVGATITCVPFQIGTVANLEGGFTLVIPDGEQIISITMIGYKEKRYRIGTASHIGNVILEDDYDILDDGGQSNSNTSLLRLGYIAASDALGAIATAGVTSPAGAAVGSLLAVLGFML